MPYNNTRSRLLLYVACVVFSLLCGVMYIFFPRHIDNDDIPLSLSDEPELSDHTMTLPVS